MRRNGIGRGSKCVTILRERRAVEKKMIGRRSEGGIIENFL